MNQAKVWILSNDKGEHLALEKDGQFTFFGSHTVYNREVLEKSFEFDGWMSLAQVLNTIYLDEVNSEPLSGEFEL
jgi:hypothetical protein